MSDDLKNIIEAVLLVSDGPVNVARIQSLFEEEARPEAARIHDAIAALQADCENRGIELKKIGSGYRYQTVERYADYLRKLHAVKPPRLSRALLETLAIVAYRQPVTRGDIEEVRGVAVSTDIMQRLVEREWVKEVGVRDVVGRPALFGTTPEFLSYFNLGSLKDLPNLMDQRALGEIAGEMDSPLPPELLAALEGDTLETEQEDGDELAERSQSGQENSGTEDDDHLRVAESGENGAADNLAAPMSAETTDPGNLVQRKDVTSQEGVPSPDPVKA